MSKGQFLAVIFGLVCVGLLYQVGYVRSTQTPKTHQGQMRALKEELEAEKLRLSVAQQRALEYKQEVAYKLKGSLNTESPEAYPERSIASTLIRSPELQLGLPKSITLLKRAKAHYREARYKEAEKTASLLVEEFSDSPFVTEALFLKAESAYKVGELDNCLQTIRTIVSQFPENDLSGYSLLRLALIYESQDRPSEAMQIYRTVQAQFNLSDLKDQSAKGLKRLARE